MAAVTAPRVHRSLLGIIGRAMAARARRRGRPSRVAAAISDHALTFAAMAAVDVGMFHLGLVAGWVAVGVSLLLVDLKLEA